MGVIDDCLRRYMLITAFTASGVGILDNHCTIHCQCLSSVCQLLEDVARVLYIAFKPRDGVRICGDV